MTSLLNTFVATVATLAVSATLAAAFAIVGLSLRRAFGITRHDRDDVFQSFWVGFGCVLTVLLAANFLVPIRQTALWLLLIAAAALWIFWLRRDEFVLRPSPPVWAIATAGIFCLWVSNLALGPVTYFDTALYHMQGVRWAHEYPVVPGLANLFGPLGFNNGSFVYNAMLNVGPWNGASWHVSNGVFVCVLGVQLLFAGSTRRDPSPHGLFCLLMLPLAVNSALDGRVPSYSTVVPMSLVLMAIAVSLSRALDAGRSDAERAFDYFTATALAATAVAVKSSAGVFAVGTAVVTLWGLARHVSSRGLRQRALIWTTVFVMLTAGIWIYRGILLSGYPLFPSAAFALSVDWRAPIDHARAEFDFVLHSSLGTAEKYPFVTGEVQGFFVWFRPWVKTALYDLYDAVIPGLLALAAAIGLAVRWRGLSARCVAWTWPLAIPALVAIAAWWIVAPMAHYGTAFFWIAAAAIAAVAGGATPRVSSRLLAWTLVLALSPAILTPAWPRVFQGASAGEVIGSVAAANFKQASPGGWFQADENRTVRTPFTTTSGLVLQVPQGKYGRCRYADVLCTPNPAPNLRLRVPGRVEDGFAVDGDWQMIGWPEPWRSNLLPALRESWKKGRN